MPQDQAATDRRPDEKDTGIGRRPAPRLVSIVVPVFNEAGNVERLADAVDQAMAGRPYELLFVDDGSRDDTLKRIARLREQRPHICAVSLSRNFGHQNALAAGLDHARGSVVVTMDGDLQHPPRLIPELIERWRDGARIVHTRRSDTAQVPWLKRMTSRGFYGAFSLLSGVPIEPGMADFRLMDRVVVDALKNMREGQLLLRGLLVWMGYPSAIVPFTVEARHSGRTKYTVRKMLKLAVNGILSFSTIPLRMSLWIGAITGLLSFIELAFVVIAWWCGRTIPGWASTLGITAFFFGILFLVLGVQGQYLLRLYELARNRPSYLVDAVLRTPEDEDAGRQAGGS